MPTKHVENTLGPDWIVRPHWGGAIVVCGKCLKRHDEGRAVRRSLKAEVKARVSSGTQSRKIRIIKTACLGLCPRGAVALASAQMLAVGEIMLVRNPNGIATAVDRLLSAGGGVDHQTKTKGIPEPSCAPEPAAWQRSGRALTP